MQRTDFDVIVIGGGTAGSIATIAAAREGARTCLVERAGHLGPALRWRTLRRFTTAAASRSCAACRRSW